MSVQCHLSVSPCVHSKVEETVFWCCGSSKTEIAPTESFAHVTMHVMQPLVMQQNHSGI